MRLLILGGTLFLGRHLVDAARAAGHEVTLFHRGRTGAGLFPDVERLLGDREGDLAALRHRRWDAVVDTCGFRPGIVRASAAVLADAVEHYVFISSISVYADPQKPRIVESDAVGPWADGTPEVLSGETYGPMKAAC
jgi:2'-hydroxyisoflavone reductase